MIFLEALESFISVWLVEKLDNDGGFPLLVLMFSVSSCSIVALCWVVVNILVLLDFLSMWVLFRLRFSMSGYKAFPVIWCGKSSCFFLKSCLVSNLCFIF